MNMRVFVNNLDKLVNQQFPNQQLSILYILVPKIID